MTKKFLKEWGLESRNWRRGTWQCLLDGGAPISRRDNCVVLGEDAFGFSAPSKAVRFAAALNKLRRPLRLIKKDLDADWAARVKERDNQTCALCGVQGDIVGRVIPAHDEIDDETGQIMHVKERTMKDVLTAHHWLKTKARAGMARWARACGVTVHFAEHIHTLHENPCWMDLRAIHDKVAAVEAEPFAIEAAEALVNVEPTEARVRALWMERCGKKEAKTHE